MLVYMFCQKKEMLMCIVPKKKKRNVSVCFTKKRKRNVSVCIKTCVAHNSIQGLFSAPFTPNRKQKSLNRRNPS